MSVVAAYDDFDRKQVKSLCKEVNSEFVSPQFVHNVLKQLTADSVLGVAAQDGNQEACRYAWIQDRKSFDIPAWIEQQLTGGNQVSQAPREERPRERLLEHGAQHLKTGELLAILIRSGRKGESAVQAGQRVAAHFQDSLDRLPHFSGVELKKISKAVSEVAFCQIMAGVELGRRVHEAVLSKTPSTKINSTKAAIAYCARQFARLACDARQEEFHIVTLDTKLQPIQTHQITVGTLDASLVHPREVFRPAVRDAASSVLLVHNHPSGDPTPSRQDHQVTERMKSAGELLGIKVIDHIIVAKDETISLAEWT
jgi:DNA repair protein RadC